MYRPNFCAECGEQIVRLRWRVWTIAVFARRATKDSAGGARRGRSLLCVALVRLRFSLAGGRCVPPRRRSSSNAAAPNSPALLERKLRRRGQTTCRERQRRTPLRRARLRRRRHGAGTPDGGHRNRLHLRRTHQEAARPVRAACAARVAVGSTGPPRDVASRRRS